jgi:two-component system, chemotaxis family, chemotaxis protein CheY
MQIEQTKPVLVVEDSLTVGRIICGILGRLGFKDVDLVSNGLDALVQLEEKKYAMIISDWNMEPMSGYELLKQIRSDEKLTQVCFLMVSAQPSIENVVAARNARADSYLIKPFTAETLKIKIEEAARSRNSANATGRQSA